MQNLDVSKTVNAWSSLADTVFVPHTEAEYDRLVSLLDRLVDEVGEDESPLRLWRLSAYSSKSMKTSTFRSCLQNSWRPSTSQFQPGLIRLFGQQTGD